ncbi:NAD(P)H-dependent glycerol-3-phosphate dehydrogenase, partial [Candidatus Riflebacteria bacterium]
MARIIVFGSGSWGSTFAHLLSQKNSVYLWGRDKEKILKYSRKGRNTDYLPSYKLCEDIHFCSDLNILKEKWDLAVFAVPAQSFRDFLQLLPGNILPRIPYINLAKGIELHSGKILSSVFIEKFPHLKSQYCCLSGPNLAEEILQGKPASAVLASFNAKLARDLSSDLSFSLFRIYASVDIQGVEIAGAVKNIFAIASGICEGLNLGVNARAALLARSLAELMRFGRKFGGKPSTFYGLSGIGDIMATCFSPLSRNFRTGLKLAEHREIDDIIKELGSVAEGVATTKITNKISKKMGIYQILPSLRERYDFI